MEAEAEAVARMAEAAVAEKQEATRVALAVVEVLWGVLDLAETERARLAEEATWEISDLSCTRPGCRPHPWIGRAGMRLSALAPSPAENRSRCRAGHSQGHARNGRNEGAR